MSKRLPVHELRNLVRDGRTWLELAQVIKPDQNGEHFYKDTAGGKSRAMVEVVTIPGGVELTCRMGTRPTYYVPPVGAMVLVAVPSGEVDHCPCIIGVLDNGAADEEVGTDKTLVSSEVPYTIKAPSVKVGAETATEKAVLGDTYKSAFDDFLTKLSLALSSVQPSATDEGQAIADTIGKINSLKAAAYLSATVKVNS